MNMKLFLSCFMAAPISLLMVLAPVPAQDASEGSGTDSSIMVQHGYISADLEPVRLAGTEVFRVNADAGGFTAKERSLIIERNMNNALFACRNRSADDVDIIIINKLPVVRLGGKHVITVDHSLAAANNSTCLALAERFANNMKIALQDKYRINCYLSDLYGDFLHSPYTPPAYREQWKAARGNHAAQEMRTAWPVDMVSSAAIRNEGFKALKNKDPVAAEAFFRSALVMEPENERARYGLGAALLKQGKVDDAITNLELARWQDHDDAQVHMLLGQALESKGLDNEALERYREAHLLRLEDPQPSLFIADLRETRDDIARSARELDESYKNCPQSAHLYLKRKDQIGWRLVKPY